MKKIILLPLVFFIAFLSCKKSNTDDTVTIPHPVTPVAPPDPYAAITINPAQQSIIMLATATWCPWCGEWGEPDMNTLMSGKTNSDITTAMDASRINAIALHPSNSPGDLLFNTISVNISTYFGMSAMPDVWADGLNCWVSPGQWNNKVKETQARTNPICAVGINKVKGTNSYTVYVKVKFFSTQTGEFKLGVYAVEDSVVARQNVHSKGYVSSYVHRNVLRAEITSNAPLGVQLFNGTSQTEYKLKYTYTVPTGVNIDKVKFVGVVHKMYGSGYWYAPNSCTSK